MPEYYELNPIITNQRLEEKVLRAILNPYLLYLGPIGEIIYEAIFTSQFTETFLEDLAKIRYPYVKDIA